MGSSDQIRKFILENLTRHEKDIILATIQRFGLSRQAILKHMHTLINQKQVVVHGKTRDRIYELKPLVNFSKTIDIQEGFSTSDIMKKQILPNLKYLKKNIYKICEFSISAILSNVIDHANATTLYFKLYITHTDFHLITTDNGTGIFKNIQNYFKIEDPYIAVIEFAKGHITTDPEYHSGEELMTVVRLSDKMTIDSSGLCLKYTKGNNEWSINSSTQKKGTRIHLGINMQSKRTCEKVFFELFEKGNQKVSIPVNLVESFGKILNSRAQAQSLLRNISDIKEIEFNFMNIELIGPAFADELVRKTKAKNKSAEIKWVNTNETVGLLMSRALARIK